MQAYSDFEPEPVVGHAAVEAVGTGVEQLVAVLWIQSWAKKAVSLVKVQSPAEEHWETELYYRNCSGQAVELVQNIDLKPG